MNIQEILVSSKDLALVFNVSVRTIWAWVGKRLPKSGRGQFPLLECVRWWRENILGDIQGQASLGDQKLRYAVARARREELRVEVEEGRLIDKDVPLSWLRGHVFEAKEAFWGLPRRMAETLAVESDSKAIEVVLQKEIYKILSDLSDGKIRLKKGGGGKKCS